MTENQKIKKKQRPLATERNVQATRHSTSSSLFRHVAQTLSSETAKGQPSDNSNTEGVHFVQQSPLSKGGRGVVTS
jgi:hypothetical protein